MTTALTAMDRNQELALESRVMQFQQAYFKTKQQLVFDETGKTSIKDLLHEAGYLQEGETSVYRRFSVDGQTGKPAIDVFEFRDVLDKKEEFSYIGFSNPNEYDAYVKARDTRLMDNPSKKLDFIIGCIFGGMIGGFVDAVGALEADKSYTWNPSAWWLLVPPVVVGAIGWAFGRYLENSDEEKIKKCLTTSWSCTRK